MNTKDTRNKLEGIKEITNQFPNMEYVSNRYMKDGKIEVFLKILKTATMSEVQECFLAIERFANSHNYFTTELPKISILRDMVFTLTAKK